jgi:hypothetical protein
MDRIDTISRLRLGIAPSVAGALDGICAKKSFPLTTDGGMNKQST